MKVLFFNVANRLLVFSCLAVLAVCLILLGAGYMALKTEKASLPFLLAGLAVFSGALATSLFFFSERFSHRLKSFINTHLYINKYEYRDEWLALSMRLKEVETENDVIEALQQVMARSFYTARIAIWTGDRDHGYRLFSVDPPLEGLVDELSGRFTVAPDDPLVRYFSLHPYFDRSEKDGTPDQRFVAGEKADFLNELGIGLVAPLLIGAQVVGMIGLGPELTGNAYGQEDYDLLIALGSQAAAALLAVRMAGKLADARERRAWHRMSAFVLHDIKNAATMLSLVRGNAPAHIHKPAFQREMLEAVDDALARIEKVQDRFDLLKADYSPAWTPVDLSAFFMYTRDCIQRKLPDMTILVDCPQDIRIQSDFGMLSCILENLALNAFEACQDMNPGSCHTMPELRIGVEPDQDRRMVSVFVADNGPGIDHSLLPDTLFEPLVTTRKKGSGIGLWQARQLAKKLRGSLQAGNIRTDGAQFVLQLPLDIPPGNAL